MKIIYHYFPTYVFRECVCPWPYYSVPVSWFSWNKFPCWSPATELHTGASRVSEDRILASCGWWRSPILGRTWWPDAYWNGYPVFGNGHCQQKARCSSSISMKFELPWQFCNASYFKLLYISNLCSLPINLQSLYFLWTCQQIFLQ